jgi:hypothetical protein
MELLMSDESLPLFLNEAFLLHFPQARSAFVNDAVKSAELEKTMLEVTSRRDKLIDRISWIKAALPPMIEYDKHTGKVNLLQSISP